MSTESQEDRHCQLTPEMISQVGRQYLLPAILKALPGEMRIRRKINDAAMDQLKPLVAE